MVKDETGKQYGYLKVIERAENSKDRKARWKCICRCGKEVIVLGKKLRNGDTTSCGCIRSKGKTQIELLLKEHNIDYKREFSFSDLKDKLPLRFDFAIFDTKGKLIKLIEFQDEQHTQPSNGFYSQTLIEHDKMKVAYCKENKIPLLHLYYKKNYNIKWEDLELYNGVE